MSYTLDFTNLGQVVVAGDRNYVIHLRNVVDFKPVDQIIDYQRDGIRNDRHEVVILATSNTPEYHFDIRDISSPVYATTQELVDDIKDAVGAMYAGGPKIYRATLVSDGANITVSGEYNQLGGTPAWITDGNGAWGVTINGAFPDGKTKGWCIQAERNQEVITPSGYRDGVDDVFMFNFVDASSTLIEPTRAWNVFIEVTP
jgi:hypothetical protein